MIDLLGLPQKYINCSSQEWSEAVLNLLKRLELLRGADSFLPYLLWRSRPHCEGIIRLEEKKNARRVVDSQTAIHSSSRKAALPTNGRLPQENR